MQPRCCLVTPNKQFGAGPSSNYNSVMEAAGKTGNQVYVEVIHYIVLHCTHIFVKLLRLACTQDMLNQSEYSIAEVPA